MKTMHKIYQNNLGTSYKIENNNIPFDMIALEILQVSFLINDKELKAFVNSAQEILNHYANCSCEPDQENKMVIYKAKQAEIRMQLSYNQLTLLKDLLKGTDFKLSMNSLLKKYKIS
ncbi:hypothetical protein [Wenyingzhuangia sp. IMCC45574]